MSLVSHWQVGIIVAVAEGKEAPFQANGMTVSSMLPR